MYSKGKQATLYIIKVETPWNLVVKMI